MLYIDNVYLFEIWSSSSNKHLLWTTGKAKLLKEQFANLGKFLIDFPAERTLMAHVSTVYVQVEPWQLF